MQVFAVIAPEMNALLDHAVKARFDGNHYVIAPGQYLVATRGQIAQEVVESLGDKGAVGRFFVVPFEGYNGWHTKALWDWARSRAQI